MAVNGNEPISTGDLKSVIATRDDWDYAANGQSVSMRLDDYLYVEGGASCSARAKGNVVTATVALKSSSVMYFFPEFNRNRTLFIVPDEFKPSEGADLGGNLDIYNIPSGRQNIIFKNGIFTFSDETWGYIEAYSESTIHKPSGKYGKYGSVNNSFKLSWTVSKDITKDARSKIVTIDVLMKALGK